MNSLKRIAAAALSAALCFSMAVPGLRRPLPDSEVHQGRSDQRARPDPGCPRGGRISGRFKLSNVLGIQQPVICLSGSLHKA